MLLGKKHFESLLLTVRGQRAAKVILIVILSLPGFFFLFNSSLWSEPSPSQTLSEPIKYVSTVTAPAVGKLSMHYGTVNQYYLRAINSHKRHANRHGYPMWTLGNAVADGIWNKLAFMHQILMQELQKDPEERTEWLMWCDADSMIVNPAQPLDIFLPPSDFPDVHILGTKDQNGFNAGVFFIRVHQWSEHFISKARVYQWARPEYDIGYGLEQTAMYALMNETENQKHVLYQPRIWWNTYQFHHGYEGQKGDVLVHFPGLEGDRWRNMRIWLDILEGPEQAEWEVPPKETRYPVEVDQFWSLIREGQTAFENATSRVPEMGKAPRTLEMAAEHLKTVMWSETDQKQTVREAIDSLNKELERV